MDTIMQNTKLILFQGDSITDAGRSRDTDDFLGSGYASLVASWFSALKPELGVRFINRGISGNRVKDLVERWHTDCLELKPDLVSILIGINDCWRRYDSDDPTSAQEFEAGYRDILLRSAENGAAVVIIEPFVLPCPQDRETWRDDLDPKIAVARKLAREFGAIYVPADGLFAQAAAKRPPEFWASDGVHPSPAGHALLAQAWLSAVKL